MMYQTITLDIYGGNMEYRIRKIEENEYSVLEEFLYEAIFGVGNAHVNEMRDF